MRNVLGSSSGQIKMILSGHLMNVEMINTKETRKTFFLINFFSLQANIKSTLHGIYNMQSKMSDNECTKNTRGEMKMYYCKVCICEIIYCLKKTVIKMFVINLSVNTIPPSAEKEAGK
jgi:hypothetical protein